MNTSKIYTNQNITLIRSLTIKCSVTAFQFTRERGVHPDINREEWPYYKHILGEYHSTDTPIVLEDDRFPVDTILSRELLDNNQWLRVELDTRGTLYTELLVKYPDMAIFIKGIINSEPIDIHKVIASEDGTIVSYSETYLDIKEHTLIIDLDNWSTNYYSRWLVKDLVPVDDNYMPVYLSSYYQQLLLKLLNLRLRRVGTYEVHDHHIYLKLLSTFELGDPVNELPVEFRLWLYNNIDYITANMGSNDTLELLVENVQRYTGVMVKPVSIISAEPSFIRGTTYLEPNFSTENMLLYTQDLFTERLEHDVSAPLILSMERELTNYTNLSSNVEGLKPLRTNNKFPYLRTKILMLELDRGDRPNVVDEFKLSLDTLARNIHDENRVEFVDPMTKQIYPINNKEALLLVMYGINMLLGKTEHNLDTYTYNYLDKSLDFTHSFLLPESRELIIPYLHNLIPNDINVKESVRKSINYFDMVWILKSNIDNMAIISDIDKFNRASYLTGVSQVNVTDIPRYLFDAGIPIVLTEEYDYLEFIMLVVKAVTGLDTATYLEDDKLLDAVNKVVTKLTSYSVHVLDKRGTKDTRLRYITPTSVNGIVTGAVGKTRFKCLEDNIDTCDVDIGVVKPMIEVTYTIPVKLTM